MGELLAEIRRWKYSILAASSDYYPAGRGLSIEFDLPGEPMQYFRRSPSLEVFRILHVHLILHFEAWFLLHLSIVQGDASTPRSAKARAHFLGPDPNLASAGTTGITMSARTKPKVKAKFM